MHRIDLLAHELLSVSLIAATLVGHGPLELRHMSPMMIFHGLLPWDDYDTDDDGALDFQQGTGTTFGLDVSLAPLPRYAIHLQLQTNALRDPVKRFFWQDDGLVLDSWGALLTQQLRVPVGRGHLRLSSTIGYTMPFDDLLHGRRAPNDPAGLSSNIDYLMARPLKSNVPGDATAIDWLGFEQGPDAIVAKGAVAHDPLPGLYLSLYGSHTWKGQNDETTVNLRDVAQAELTTPSGKVTRTLQLGGSAAYHPATWLSVGAALYGSRVFSDEGSEGLRFEGTLTCRLTFGASARERLFAFDGSDGT